MNAFESGKMTMDEFKNYQRGGLRTKRLQKMGYWSLVDVVPIHEIEEKKP